MLTILRRRFSAGFPNGTYLWITREVFVGIRQSRGHNECQPRSITMNMLPLLLTAALLMLPDIDPPPKYKAWVEEHEVWIETGAGQ